MNPTRPTAGRVRHGVFAAAVLIGVDPMTTTWESILAGAKEATFLATPSMMALAASFVRKMPVDSET